MVGRVIRRVEAPGRPAREAGVCDAYGSRLSCCNLDGAHRTAHDDVQHAIADVVNGIRGLRAEETPRLFCGIKNALPQGLVESLFEQQGV